MPVSPATSVESLVKLPLNATVECSLTVNADAANVGASLTGVTLSVAVLVALLNGEVAVGDVVSACAPALPLLASHAV